MLIEPNICIACVADFHYECINKVSEFECCCEQVQFSSLVKDSEKRALKADIDVNDPKSTGRKRAAVLYPLTEDMVCEWASLKEAGGGVFPIIGCPGNNAVNRHHGPDKNTLNNESTNVHRICSPCHNRWHTRNDPIYEEFFGSEKWKTHDPITQASDLEVLEHEVYWKTNPANRIEIE